MSMNSDGGGRAGRGPALNRFVEDSKLKRKKQHQMMQNDYNVHKYDGSDPDMEPQEAQTMRCPVCTQPAEPTGDLHEIKVAAGSIEIYKEFQCIDPDCEQTFLV